jgi:hypothetical protein
MDIVHWNTKVRRMELCSTRRDADFCGGWIRTLDGRRALEKCAREAWGRLLAPGLANRIASECSAASENIDAAYAMGASLLPLVQDLAMISLAEAETIRLDCARWEIALEVLEACLLPDSMTTQARGQNPAWRADLITADVGLGIALVLRFPSPLHERKEAMRQFLAVKCLKPILADWIDDETRIHSLDSMGHNWWSVIVSGAGVIASILGDDACASRLAAKIREWAAYPGNEWSRKRPNFGAEGDYVEDFGYAQYALVNAVAFAHFHPELALVPDLLSLQQARGLCLWLKCALVPGRDGWRVQRFGDVKEGWRPLTDVWHTLARTTNDREFLRLAHEIRPHPRRVMELLLWEPFPEDAAVSKTPDDLHVFPTSGMVFARSGSLRLTVRAGETWNHNHLDAGSFVLHQDGETWVDDSGSCNYRTDRYGQYYIRAAAHNVTYAPSLEPPMRAYYEGYAQTARILCAEQTGPLKLICADTCTLSGGALLRSYRWFFVMGEEGVVIWDDLQSRDRREFRSLLHTRCSVENTPERIELESGGRKCVIYPFAGEPAAIEVDEALMGGLADDTQIKGQCISQRVESDGRLKMGWCLGTGIRAARWSVQEGAAFFPRMPPNGPSGLMLRRTGTSCTVIRSENGGKLKPTRMRWWWRKLQGGAI